MTRGRSSQHRQSVHTAARHNARVKMGNWNFLGGILEEVHVHSTMLGKIWLSILFIFRMLVLGVAAEDAWLDEQEDFLCNTNQPGCRNVCYNLAFPISLIRYWVLQVICVSSPALVYMGHALYRLRALQKAKQRKALEQKETMSAEKPSKGPEQRDQAKQSKAPLRGALLGTYVAHVIIRSVVEAAFMATQYLVYGLCLHPLFKCQEYPCPNVVDCYVSRPTEKSVFMVFMQSIAALSLLLSVFEVMHICYKKMKKITSDLCRRNKESPQDKNKPKEHISYSTSEKLNVSHVHTEVNLTDGMRTTQTASQQAGSLNFPSPSSPDCLFLRRSVCAEGCDCHSTLPKPNTHFASHHCDQVGNQNRTLKRLEHSSPPTLSERALGRPHWDPDSVRCSTEGNKTCNTNVNRDTKASGAPLCNQKQITSDSSPVVSATESFKCAKHTTSFVCDRRRDNNLQI